MPSRPADATAAAAVLDPSAAATMSTSELCQFAEKLLTEINQFENGADDDLDGADADGVEADDDDDDDDGGGAHDDAAALAAAMSGGIPQKLDMGDFMKQLEAADMALNHLSQKTDDLMAKMDAVLAEAVADVDAIESGAALNASSDEDDADAARLRTLTLEPSSSTD
ncbi:hypothetical protein CXG81DRAFT_24713 [Caulochytrium protostelioides]|uniref:Uncharacterized protein n=1 Tax=Caulochytrium protostelioides TaxID=1555241 RepID=A0A4P9XB74_9FUNG|nr:hypothetical protein CXG81DRAFT_24713 [Caulochytrium protostelioides]|eukprot:RKP02657.1 hypothetical protein CXG81DRAFT_24713 [Caulochytrium protostelioides]